MPRKNKYEWQKIGQQLMEETRRKNMQVVQELVADTPVESPRLPTKCDRCGGRMYDDGEGGASCLMCGEYVYAEVKEKKIQQRPWPPQGRTW